MPPRLKRRKGEEEEEEQKREEQKREVVVEEQNEEPRRPIRRVKGDKCEVERTGRWKVGLVSDTHGMFDESLRCGSFLPPPPAPGPALLPETLRAAPSRLSSSHCTTCCHANIDRVGGKHSTLSNGCPLCGSAIFSTSPCSPPDSILVTLSPPLLAHTSPHPQERTGRCGRNLAHG